MRIISHGILSLLLMLLTAELAFRWLQPTPRSQVVREDSLLNIYNIDDTPVWDLSLTPALAARDCATAYPERRSVVFIGDSIFYLTGSKQAADNFSTLLQARLDSAGAPWCVHNLARSAFGGPQKVAVAKRALQELQPDLVVYGIWSEQSAYWNLDGVLYELSAYPRDEAGYPLPPFPLPGVLHHVGFRYSAAWRYATLALAPDQRVKSPRPEDFARPLMSLLEAAEAAGSEVLAVQLPRLDRSFEQSSAHPAAGNHAVLQAASDRDAHTLVLAERLRSFDVEALRLDTCCHFNDAGHRVLAEIFETQLTDLFPLVEP